MFESSGFPKCTSDTRAAGGKSGTERGAAISCLLQELTHKANVHAVVKSTSLS